MINHINYYNNNINDDDDDDDDDDDYHHLIMIHVPNNDNKNLKSVRQYP